MKAFLMYKNQDFDLQKPLPSNEQELIQDLDLQTLFNAMGLEDKFLLDVAKKSVLLSLKDIETILYRQDILRDCLKNSSIVKDLYNLALEALENERKHSWGFTSKYPSTILYVSIESMETFLSMLAKLREFTDKHADKFESEGFTNLFKMIKKEITEEFFSSAKNHLKRLRSRGGVLVSAELGKGLRSNNYVLHELQDRKQDWIAWIIWLLQQILPEDFFSEKPPPQTFYLHPRDESGARALGALRDRGINVVANALAQSSDHVLSFFNMLRTELAFYIGCLNLYENLIKIGEETSFPQPMDLHERYLNANELYDVCLALSMNKKVVSNLINGNGKDIVVITGANRGGKSIFLRSVGLAQLMMQCGMFVPAKSLRANLCDGLFTHYKRREDVTMKSGKLDEELNRMSSIADHLNPNSMILFNESFSATNEREGSEIATQITSALLERKIKILFVTHQFEFAHGLYDKDMKNALFLRAERKEDGTRTFKLIEAEPLQTSFGKDLYNKIFQPI